MNLKAASNKDCRKTMKENIKGFLSETSFEIVLLLASLSIPAFFTSDQYIALKYLAIFITMTPFFMMIFMSYTRHFPISEETEKATAKAFFSFMRYMLVTFFYTLFAVKKELQTIHVSIIIPLFLIVALIEFFYFKSKYRTT